MCELVAIYCVVCVALASVYDCGDYRRAAASHSLVAETLTPPTSRSSSTLGHTFAK